MNLIYWICWSLVRFISGFIFGLKVANKDLIPPEGSFILAANHIAYTDPPLLGSPIKRAIHFMAKKELFKNKLFGSFLSIINSHPVNRRGFDRQAIETAIKILQSGEALLMFPEGTRSKTEDFLPPRPGIGMVARKSGAPVLPAFIYGSNRLKAALLRRTKFGIIYGKLITGDEIAQYEDTRDGYKLLSMEIMRRIASLKEDFNKKSPMEA